ncbi:MAG TPA: 50S ribosomal protein L31e [Candidatus Bathyarchaeia archaeon]|nr:50S ribosomal protein L31e [Candidatus Bathyarchaeia archaeon]
MEKEAKKEDSKTEEKETATEPVEEELEAALEETPEEMAKETKEQELPVAEEKEEAKPAKKKPKKEEEEIVEERIYTVPLSKALIMPAHKRTARAVRILRAFITKNMKLEAKKEGETEEEQEPSRLVISNEVNERMWARGAEKPPRKIRIRAAKDKEGNVTVYLAEGD